MPKENTHLLFAHGLLEDLTGRPMLKEISGNLNAYLLGSIIPDTFYYGSRKGLTRISETFHGRDGNPTNTTIIQVLQAARGPRDVAFILGYITHCALDITFHPVVYYLSGNYYDQDPVKKQQAVHRHRRLETCMDASLENPLRLHRLIRTRFLEGLAFEEIVTSQHQTPIGDIRASLRRQIVLNLLFTSTVAYCLARMAVRQGMVDDPSYLGLFYADAPRTVCLPSPLRVADLVEGRERTTTVAELFTQARGLACTMMEAAYAFWKGDAGMDDLLRSIPGLSLDTGMLGVSTAGIRHTAESDRG
ncbi:MAG TPA: zinc dependent phospholipase C family protein [Deltaproteobacteria bacterium]|nr:zinc dependent phospholipase C family protein [Deltaproteobacteria bacterium]HQI81860.1 zinc dependent phospholipase C family protein [Deltaproteobacteria bacterium]